MFKNIDKTEKKHGIETGLVTIVCFLYIAYRDSCFNAQKDRG
jgi:hypothetical protein